ncbi:MAG: TraB/GumN family protein [Deltaproteobacteria bacterium]|nr:TraB/GumN family protein [Deltaproteobacteria bacterium]
MARITRAGSALFGVALLVASCAACVARGPRPGPPSIYLWEIRRPPEVEVVGWVLGSVHLSREGDGIDAAVVRAYEAADSLAVELDVDTIDPTALLALMTTKGRYEPGRSLSGALGQEPFARLAEHLSGLGLPVSELDRLRPWVASLMLVLAPALGKGGAGGTGETGGAFGVGVDRFFLAKARGDKSIVSLETIDEQIAALTSLSEAVQLEDLLELIAVLDAGGSLLDPVIDAYMEGDVDPALGGALEPDAQADPERAAWMRRLIQDRNAVMAARVEVLLDEGERPFVVVGAGHVRGSEGVPALLAGRGFHLAPVEPTGDRLPLVLPPAAAVKPPSVRVVGHRVAWPCEAPQASTVEQGGVTVQVTTCTTSSTRYVLTRAPLSSAMGAMMTRDQVYGLAVAQMGQMLGASESTADASEVSGLPARRFFVVHPGGVMVGVVVWADDTLYTFVATATSLGEAPIAPVLEVLRSFELEVGAPGP